VVFTHLTTVITIGIPGLTTLGTVLGITIHGGTTHIMDGAVITTTITMAISQVIMTT